MRLKRRCKRGIYKTNTKRKGDMNQREHLGLLFILAYKFVPSERLFGVRHLHQGQGDTFADPSVLTVGKTKSYAVWVIEIYMRHQW